MNLKIKCDTPREQVLVLRKFKKLVPECEWVGGENPLELFPFADFNNNEVHLHLKYSKVFYRKFNEPYAPYNPIEFTASDFLRDDWKMEEKKAVRCSWDEITKLEKDDETLTHMKLYTSDFSPKEVEKILNEHLKNNKGNPKTDKSENESLRLGLQKIRENFNKSLNELEESLRVKKESL